MVKYDTSSDCWYLVCPGCGSEVPFKFVPRPGFNLKGPFGQYGPVNDDQQSRRTFPFKSARDRELVQRATEDFHPTDDQLEALIELNLRENARARRKATLVGLALAIGFFLAGLLVGGYVL